MQHQRKYLHPQVASTVSLLLLTVTAAVTATLLLSDEPQFTEADSNHFHLYNCQCYSHFPHTEAAQRSHRIFSLCVFSY